MLVQLKGLGVRVYKTSASRTHYCCSCTAAGSTPSAFMRASDATGCKGRVATSVGCRLNQTRDQDGFPSGQEVSHLFIALHGSAKPWPLSLCRAKSVGRMSHSWRSMMCGGTSRLFPPESRLFPRESRLFPLAIGEPKMPPGALNSPQTSSSPTKTLKTLEKHPLFPLSLSLPLYPPLPSSYSLPLALLYRWTCAVAMQFSFSTTNQSSSSRNLRPAASALDKQLDL